MLNNKAKLKRAFCGVLRTKNIEVELAHTEVMQMKGTLRSMIVLHGILGNKAVLKGIVSQPEICLRRWSFLVDMRNHY